MKCLVLIVAACILSAGSLTAAPQAPAAARRPLTNVIGAVVAVDAESRLMVVKADSGQDFTFAFDEAAAFLLVPPGEKSLDKATPISLADVSRGDRVFGRGETLDDGKTLPVHRLIVMSKAAIEKKNTAEQEEWLRRAISGRVMEVRARTKEIVVQVARMPRQRGGPSGAPMRTAAAGGAAGTPAAANAPGAAAGPQATGPGAFGRAFGGPANITVQVFDATVLRHYAPDSVKFADAKESAFAEIKPGDLVRVLGELNIDGLNLNYKAEKLVSGAFQIIGGTIAAVSPASNEIKLKLTYPAQENATVLLSNDTQLKVVPKEMVTALLQRFGGPGAQRVSENWLNGLPPIGVGELKVGEGVLVFATTGKTAARFTAINFVAGMQPYLTYLASLPRARSAGDQGMSWSLPGGLDAGMGGGMGLP